MRIRRSTRVRLVAALLALEIAADTPPAHALPVDGSTFLGDRGIVADLRPSGGIVSAELFAGAASYALPLELPPGTGGLTPSLVLRYGSGSREESWVGAGWSLGLPTITRSLRRGVPRYDDGDRFELDGQELVPVPGAPGRFRTRRETFLRIEREADGSFTVRQKDGVWLRLGTGAESRVEDGPERTFQWLTAEMHDPLGNAFAARWDRRDPGTAYLVELRYTLRRDASGALRSLDGDPGRDRVVRFELEPRPDVASTRLAGLERTLRHRLRGVEVRAAGGLVRRWRLSYERSPDSQRSLLVSIALSGADADAASPTPPWVTRFRYRTNAPGVEAGWAPDPAWAASWPQSLALVQASGRDRGVRIADVDGDALPDLIRAYGFNPGDGRDVVSSSDSGVYLSTGAGFASRPSPRYPLPYATGVSGNRIPLSFAMQFPTGLAWGTGMTPIDVTGDGRVDFIGTVGFASGTFSSYLGPLEQSHQGPWCASTANGFSCLPPTDHYTDHGLYMAYQGDAMNFVTMQPSFVFAGGNSQFADVDGDGLVDVVVRGSDRFFPPGPSRPLCTLAHSVSYVVRNLGGLHFERLPIDPELRDFDTDCDRQRAVISSDYQTCRFRPSNPVACQPWIAHTQTDFVPSPIDGKTWLLAGYRDRGVAELDLDGDGLADVVQAYDHGVPPRRNTFLGDGRKGYVSTPAWNLPTAITEHDSPGPENPHSEGASRDLGLRFADVNGDGRIDLVKADWRSQSVWLNAGLDASGASPWRVPPPGSWQLPPEVRFVDGEYRDTGTRLVDLDGDGLPEIVRAQGSTIEVWRNLGAVPDLLVEVTEPLGGRTLLSYTPSTRFDHRGDDDAPDLPRTLPLLTRIETDDALGGRSVRTLSYAGGRFEPKRRELRGFRTVTEKLADGTRTLTRFHQSETLSGLVESVVRQDPAGATWLETRYEYTSDDGKEPFVVMPAAVTRIAWDGGSVPRRTRTEWRYDGGGPIVLGNRTATIELGEVDAANRDLVPADTRSSVFSYASENAALHLADRVTRTQLVAGLPGAGPVLRETRLFYDGASTPDAIPTRGLVTQRTDVLGEAGRPDPTTRFAYDGYGNLVALLDPRFAAGDGGGFTLFEHDPLFHTFRSAIVNPLGQRTELGYAPDPSCAGTAPPGLGLVSREVGPNERAAGTARVRCYDAFGRIQSERSPDGAGLRLWGYDDRPGLGALLRFERTTSGGALRSERITLDGLGRPVATRSLRASGPPVLAFTFYDALGRVAARSAPYFEGEVAPFTVYGYDPLGRLATTTLPGAGRTWRVERTPWSERIIDPLGSAVEQQRDAYDRLVAVLENDGDRSRTTRFAWSAADELVAATDPAGNRAELVYDALGRRRLLRDPDLGLVRTEYDANGNEVEQVSAAGRVTIAYDSLDRPLERRLDGAVEARFGYDAAWLGVGRLAWREDAAGRHTVVAYDGEGRPRVETDTRGASTLAFVTAYDPLGQPSERLYPTGERVLWQHDAAGLLTGIEAGGVEVASAIAWSADGALASWRAANGVTWTARRDATTRLPAEIRVLKDGNALESLRFAFDAADRMLRLDDEREPSRSRSFVHDALGRLRSAEGPYGPGLARRRLHYAYDLAGSLVCKDAADLAGCAGGISLLHPAPGEPRPHAATSVDGVPAIYTAAGHLESLGDRRYGYDVLGRLTHVSEAGRLAQFHVFDAGGARAQTVDLTASRVRTRFAVGDDFEWDFERRQARVHVFLGGGPIATRATPFDGGASLAGASGGALPTPSGMPEGAAAPLLALGAAIATLALLRRKGELQPLLRPTVSGVTAIAFGLATSLPARALAPDGDLNRDRRLDAADALLAWEIARGARAPTPDELAHGDLAPLGAAPESPSEIDPGDVAMLWRALSGHDVDGDGIASDDELALGTSPFSSDSDGDARSDARERMEGTDPTDPDTDGDGRPDGADSDPRRGIVYRQLDPLGSPLVVTRDDGGVLARPLYRPFGDPVPGAATGAHPSEPGFDGRRFEAGIGLYDYGARFYDPRLGRFVQADSALADPLEPGAWNRYAYAAQDPLRRVDPTGHSSVLATLFGLAAGALAAGSWARGESGGEAVLGGLLNLFTGAGGIRVGVRSDGAIASDIGYIPTIRWLPGQDTKPAAQQVTQLRVMTTAELRFGDILLTNDGGLSTAISKLQYHGFGHALFVLHADAFSVVVASSDDRGRYIENSMDPAVGGRRWAVLRTRETLDEGRVDAYVADLKLRGGLNGGIRQYLGNGGGNVCSSFAADLYRVGDGKRIPPGAFNFVTPDELVRYLGPPIGQIYIPRHQEIRNAPAAR